MKIKPLYKHCLTSRQISRRGHEIVKFYDNGWRYGYILKKGRKWATGRKSACGSPLKLSLSDEGKGWAVI